MPGLRLGMRRYRLYIVRANIKNIKSISDLTWDPFGIDPAGWHVIIGDNGSGKSTFLRALALALVGPTEAAGLRQKWSDWLGNTQQSGNITLFLERDKKLDKFSGAGASPDNPYLLAFIRLGKDKNDDVKLSSASKKAIEKTEGTSHRGSKLFPEKHVWSGRPGWFSAAYGPFRRFSGGDKDYDRIFYSNPKLAAHLSVFGEDVALTECIRWLQELQFKKLEKHPEGQLLDQIMHFVNQEEFLPHKAHLESVSSQGVEFVDGNGRKLQVEELSDGYRSVLSMTFELVRQLAITYGSKAVFTKEDPTRIHLPGVVLIDEVDAHLHPTWQRRIGKWLTDHFPHLQFIVTTHSPLICQAAIKGSVWRLPKPGTDQSFEMVTGETLERLVYGNVLDAYSTEAFGQDVSRSEESKKKLYRLAELNRKELRSGLAENEKIEQEDLRSTLPSTAHVMP